MNWAMVTDANERHALVAIRELGRAGIATCAVHTEAGAPAFASRWCAASATVPDFSRDPDAFVDALLELCAVHRPRVLISCHDGAIEAVRARRDEVERSVAVALAPEAGLAAAVEKPRTFEAAMRLGVPLPRGAVVTELNDADAALDETGLPAVIKPARSWVLGHRLAGSVTSSRETARGAIAQLLEAGSSAIVQEWLPGAREAVTLVYGRGRVWARFAQRATRMYPPLGGSSVVRVSIPLPHDATAAAERLVAELGIEGISEIEFRRDREGRAALMEINPRLSASVELAVRAGMPFPRLLYAWAAGESLEPADGYRTGVRMRWLGGDLSWLEAALRDRGHPDLPGPGRALRTFVTDFARPSGYDYWDPTDPRPALVAAGAAARHTTARLSRRARRAAGVRGADAASGADTEVAIVGAGPYGLSLAAHLTGRGIHHEIFGEPMGGWLEHMPAGMKLKSEGCGSNLSEPTGEHSLARFCAEHGIEYGHIGIPVTADTFIAYGRWFQERFVPDVRRTRVGLVCSAPEGFQLTLSSGDELRARRVVVATGLDGCARIPAALKDLPPGTVSHSYDHSNLEELRDKSVVVVGAGQSALETATLVHEHGGSVSLVARTPELVWNPPPRMGPRRLRRRVRYPRSGLGDGKAVFFYAKAPDAFHALPGTRRLRLAYSVLGPAGAWWLRSRFEDNFDVLVGRTISAAQPVDGNARLRLEGTGGTEELTADHVVAATGYRPDVHGLELLDPALRNRVASLAGAPVLSRSFESTVSGLHFAGFAAAPSFGPLMRFVLGCEFTAGRISRHVAQ